MRRTDRVTVLFAAAAGPQQGYGHLVRCGVLASALGVRPRIALRAPATTRREARALGWQVYGPTPALLAGLAPDLLVVDDPSPVAVARWIRAARARQVPVAAVFDLGYRHSGADLTIDGSLARTTALPADLDGPAYSILDPALVALRHEAPAREAARVVIALGGGRHVRGVGLAIAKRIRAIAPDAVIDLAPGFGSAALPSPPAGCRWIGRQMLRQSLSTATVAVVAGGVTLYEACALGTPIVAVSVTAAQAVTTRAAAAAGVAIDAAAPTRTRIVARAAADVAYLLAAPGRAACLAAAAQALVDGEGTARVVARLNELIQSGSTGRARHAA